MLTGDSGFANYLLLRLLEGRIFLSFQGFFPRQANSMRHYNDTQLHTVQVTFISGDIFFVIDGREQPTIGGLTGETALGRLFLGPKELVNYH